MRFSRLLPWFFVLSGFCSLLDQVVWLRLSMAAFGVTTPMISILLSVFMAGLAAGSWAGGALARRLGARPAALPIRLYGAAELLIALSLYVVPDGFQLGRRLLAGSVASAWGSHLYHLGAAAWMTLLLFPFCLAMGATVPLALWALRREGAPDQPRAFSRLYLANVVGAALGTVVSALVLIEILGLRGTLQIAASVNALLAAGALVLSLGAAPGGPEPAAEPSAPAPGRARAPLDRRALAILFTTGFASLGMEVLWVRQMTPYLGNLVYSFAIILGVYLTATFVGSALYRRGRLFAGSGAIDRATPWLALVVAAVLPSILADPRLPAPEGLTGGALRVALGIAPFCLLLGALTPAVVDHSTGGDPDRVGRAYAVNVVGGILGPLAAGFLLAPRLSEAHALLLLGLLPLAFVLWTGARDRALGRRLGSAAAGAAVALVATFAATSYERSFADAIVRRDHTATVVAMGSGLEKRLLVNGVGMTALTPITKLMAHLPMALAERRPRSGLVLCFGMGTSFRSMRSWGAETTAIELVPSVADLFGEFHPDGPALLSAEARIVVDDGRRFLEFVPASYDVIVIDPPPPVQAAGSSLLYSVEFYRAAKARLAPDGVLQQWIPGGEPRVVAAFARAFAESFPYRRAFRSIEGWGVHMIGSERPLPERDAATLARRMPQAARRDLVEWGPEETPRAMLQSALAQEIPFDRLLAYAPDVPALTDDFPLNEYFALRLAGRRIGRWLD